jgi:hypothetical protein
MDLLVKCRCIVARLRLENFDVIEPTSNTDLLGTYASTRFPFIPIPREEDDSINSALVLVEDDGSVSANSTSGVPAPSPDTRDGCTAIAASAAAVKGKIAVIIRGNVHLLIKLHMRTMVL